MLSRLKPPALQRETLPGQGMSVTERDASSDILRAIRAHAPDLELKQGDLSLYAKDIYYEAESLPVAVATIRKAEDVVALVRAAREQGFSLAARGAGLSYSSGYIPSNARTIVLDFTAMNRIVEINAVDRYVTVEAGVTWAQLREALQPLGLSTPFWGTFSGRYATIGASLSQGAKFYGSASRGASAESVLGLKLVTGRGEILVTGSAAGQHAPSPFFRNYGPDLTGPFLGDCGALGFKLEATLQLIPAPGATEVCTFTFDDPVAQMEVMARIGSELLASECLGMDPFSARARMQSEGMASDVRTLMQIISGSSSLASGLRDAAQIALSGRRFAERVGYLMNCIVEGRDGADARSRIRRVRQIASEGGGRALPPSIPKVMRAIPFPPMNGLLTPSAKRMNWLHVVVPNSRGGECFRVTEQVFERNAAMMKENGVDRGYLLSTHGPSGVGVETLIRWSDESWPIHTHYMSDKDRQKVKKRPANPAAREAVANLSKEIVAAWRDLGGVHLQIGRKYPWLETRQPETAGFIRALKKELDPDDVVNPGNLFTRL